MPATAAWCMPSRGFRSRWPLARRWGSLRARMEAGKTTTLRVLAMLLKPTSGTARIAGHDIITEPARRPPAARLSLGDDRCARPAHAPEVLAVVRPAARPRRRADEGPRRCRAGGHARPHGLHAYRPCGRLSTGQRQRVSLGRALVHDPPTLVLESRPRASTYREPAICSTSRGAAGRGPGGARLDPSVHEIERRCDRFLIIDAGRIVGRRHAS